MKFTVVYKPMAEEQLATFWLDFPDPDAVTQTANRIDYLLQFDPDQQGESRWDNVRVFIKYPLTAYFQVYPLDLQVHVAWFHCHPWKPNL